MFVSSSASNALLTKCRAMFGKRLSAQDVHALLACRTVSQVAAYLKQNTHYSYALADIDENHIHRNRLEEALNKQLFYEYASLCRYELSVGEHLAEYVVMRMELRQLLSFLRLLSAGKPQEYLFAIPYFFEQHTDMNLMELSRVTSYEEFLEAAKPSSFYPIFKRFAPKKGAQFDYAAIEHAMYAFLFSRVLKNVDKYYHGKAQSELYEILGSHVELMNVLSIYRLKKYYSADPSLIKTLIHPYNYRISQKLINEMINAESAQEVLDLFFARTPYRHDVPREEIENAHVDVLLRIVSYRTARRFLRFSTNPSVVLLAFIELSETEISEIVTIIEGIRYGLSSEEIMAMIVIDDYK